MLCARCTRFSEQIAGDPFIELFERGALEQVARTRTSRSSPTSPATRCRSARSARSPARRTGSGPAVRPAVDAERLRALRVGLRAAHRLAAGQGDAPAGRRGPRGQRGVELRQGPVRVHVRDPVRPADRARWSATSDTGELVPTSWTDALERTAEALAEARDTGGVGVLPGGRLTVEDAYAYAKFARVALGTNDVDFRARPHSAEELDFLAARVAGLGPETGAVTYGDLEAAPAVLLVGFEPEEESPIVFLRLRKAARKRGQKLFAVAPWLTNGVRKAFGTLLATRARRRAAGAGRAGHAGRAADAPVAVLPEQAPEQTVAGSMAAGVAGPVATDVARAAAEALRQPGAVVLVGERAAEVAGAAHRGGPAGLDHRRPDRLGAAAGRRARRGRGRRAADPAARRPAGGRRRRPRRGRAGLGRAAADHAGPGRGRHRGRGGRRRAGRARGRRRRPRRPARPAGGARGAGPGRVRAQPGDPAVRGDRPGRRGASRSRRWSRSRGRTSTGRAGRGRSRRPSAAPPGAAGRPGAARAGRRDGRRPRPARRSEATRRRARRARHHAGGPGRPTRWCARR